MLPMYFILSKVLFFLLYPILWILALLLVALLAKDPKRKRRFLIAGMVALYVFTTPVFLGLVTRAWNVDPVVHKGRVYSCAIVLGGFSSTGKNGKPYFNGAADRFIQGLLALKTGRAKHILITGGNGGLIQGTFREGTWVKTQLDSLKIPDSCVLIESNSRNTIENAKFSKPVLQKAGLKPPYLLITSDFHMRRSNMIFKNQGYDVDLYPANYTGGSFSFYDLVPDGGEIGGWTVYLKEMIGYVVDGLKK
jgi:uncharacterized SAM-binding protein YcdF (DUF218 family)